MPTNADVSRIRGAIRQQMPLLSARFGVESLSLFGSYVRGEAQEGSDVDVLVTFQETPGLLRFVELENYLSDLLHLKVDLVLRDALKPELGKRILREAVAV